MDHHTLAAISVSGICLDVLGGLYLAYDLLGGQHGPLRLLTRVVTYSVVFGIGYGLGLGLFFGIAAGLATGITIAIELHRTSRGGHYPLRWETVFSAIRGLGFAIGLYRQTGVSFAFTFGALITCGQIIAYRRGVRPGMDYASSRRPRLTRRQFRAAIIRTLGYMAAFLLCSRFVRHVEHSWTFALRGGVVIGIVTVVGTTVNPFIEYYADNLAERRLGVIGIMVVFCGFILQSVQYLAALFDVPVT